MRRLEISMKRSAGMSLQRKDGATEKQYIYPDIEDGINGVRFVDACVESNANGNVWVEI